MTAPTTTALDPSDSPGIVSGPDVSRPETEGASEDLAHGQVLLVTARWILVLAGLGFALWNPAPVETLRVQIGMLLALAGVNFYLHAQLLMRRPALRPVAYLTSAADLAVITGFVLSAGGFASGVYIFYFPALVALSVAFPAAVTFALTGATIASYAVISLVTDSGTDLDGLVLILRVLMLAAVATCGSQYARIERRRREAAPGLRRNPAQEAAEDIFFGQVVLIIARWFLIAAGTIYVLWMASTVAGLIAALLPLLALIGVNFCLHGRYLLERPANRTLILAMAGLDLAIITALILIGPEARGPSSPFFVFFYPVLLAVAFVFPRRVTGLYTLVAGLAYVAACLAGELTFVRDGIQVEMLVQRLAVFATVALLGTLYWRIQRQRRDVAHRPRNSAEVTRRPGSRRLTSMAVSAPTIPYSVEAR
jgi:hypothetical protein